MVNLATVDEKPAGDRCFVHQKELTMSNNMLGNALAQVAGPMKDFFTKLAGSDGMMWLYAFNRFLRKENPWPKFAVRWIVTLGVQKSPEAYEEALGKNVSKWARDILKKITCSKKQAKIHLTDASFAEVGLTEGGTLEEFLAAVELFGGTKCPAEAGPALRQLYRNQPQGEWMVVLMDAISDSGGDLRVFGLDSGSDGLWLASDDGRPGDRFNAGNRVVFAVPAQVS